MLREKAVMDIVCLSSDHWDSLLWTNKQHIMSRLAKAGYRVLYVDPPTGISDWHKGRHAAPFATKNWVRWTRKINENLWIHSPFVFPFGRLRVIGKVNNWLRVRLLQKIVCSLGFSDLLMWIFDPACVVFVGRIGEGFVLYDCVDAITFNHPLYQGSKLIFEERELLHKADAVTAVSQPIVDELRKFNPRTYLVNNVGDYDLFKLARSPDMKIAHDIEVIPRPILGFVGGLRKWTIDLHLLEYLASSCPSWSIVLIGPIVDCEILQILSCFSNIHLLGFKQRTELPGYLKAFDVCIIPYRTDGYFNYVFPLKFFEFMATGKPIITTNLPSIAAYRHVARIAADPDDFIRHVAEALHEKDSTLLTERIELAKQNTWESRINRIIDIVKAELAARNSKSLF